MKRWIAGLLLLFTAANSKADVVTFSPSSPNAMLLIDGKPTPAMTFYVFVKVNLAEGRSEGIVTKVEQGGGLIRYGDRKWSKGSFFMTKEIPEGDYLLLRSHLGSGGPFQVDVCYAKRAAVFHLKAGMINFIPRKILIDFVPPGAIYKKAYISQILSENAEADAATALRDYGTVTGEIRSISPIGYYELVQSDSLFKGCGANGDIRPLPQ
ncbi:hypothetical protein [Flavisphingomonas formosensis]|uniref:hypothetical protein n=1 Tax=Flavisphingomonas formosensis TaxID=861534 RepID=UPI0012F8CDFD|nr:hypothetical protein [Sphingomonas formosensis]